MNRKRLIVVTAAGAAIVVTATGAGAAAQDSPKGTAAKRTWVADSGSDRNTCTRSSPCATFAQALAYTADTGEVNVISPGDYGPMRITRSVTIRSRGHLAAITGERPTADERTASRSPVVVNCGKDPCRVVLDGLEIKGDGTGDQYAISVQAADTVRIKHTEIQGYPGGGILAAQVHRVAVEDSSVSDCLAAEGLEAIGLYLTPPPEDGGMIATARRLSVTGTDIGIKVIAEPTEGNPTTGTVNVSDSALTDNKVAVQTAGRGGALVRLNHNEITGNDTGTQILKGRYKEMAGDQILSFGNNNISANGDDGELTGTAGLRTAPAR